ncbi:hypothetical protein [Sedimentibacter sp.]|uniref:hypothetical protein n=1 Tax=Sedimentibacter sp. TaxID=1960295 RepID=UPI0028A5E03F|nr:hypothetical protein [Sedimentibacter sp.]
MHIKRNMPINNLYFNNRSANIQVDNKKFDLNSGIFNQSINSSNIKTYKVCIKTDEMLYSGGNGTGLSFYIKYAENSSEDNPVVVAKGIDEAGEEFERIININEINPYDATIVEMKILEAYLELNKGDFSSLPLSMHKMGLNERGNFIEGFRNSINEQNILGQIQNAKFYLDNMHEYQMFYDSLRDKKVLF